MTIPLPEQLRPETLSDFVGQSHLRNQIEALTTGKFPLNLLLFGPPGCGKSTLAILLAKCKGDKILRLSAPEAGLQQLRRMIAGVEILILDELHRFSKAQQDFFLPLIESGEICLIATTTENPSFSVTRQLLSRLRVLRLTPLSKMELMQLAKNCLQKTQKSLSEDILFLLTTVSNGDGRYLLNLIDFIFSLPEEKQNIAEIKKMLPEMMARHDKQGDSHYELASALIKSIRGSDADAALYYLACLLEGGEDPRFICRRLILSAAEDVGLANPQALTMAVSCQQAVEFVGMPEGYLPLAETTVYLAISPKSNSAYAAYCGAKQEVKNGGVKPVPIHLRNAVTQLQKEWKFGVEYKYPHNFPGAWVEQNYLPEDLLGRKYYKAKDQGEEPRLNSWVLRHKKFNSSSR